MATRRRRPRDGGDDGSARFAALVDPGDRDQSLHGRRQSATSSAWSRPRLRGETSTIATASSSPEPSLHLRWWSTWASWRRPFSEELAQRLAAFLDEPASAIIERFESANSGAQLILAQDLTEQQALTLVEHREDFPGVAVIPQPVRDYPNEELAAQVLGYIGKPSAVDIERPEVKGTDVVGKAGVERYYDDQLRGTEGDIVYQVDAGRSVLQRLGEKESVPGDNLILTIDSGVQAQLQESLQGGLEMARNLEMEERAEALEEQDVRTRLFFANEEAQLQAQRDAIAARAAAAEASEDGTVDEDSVEVEAPEEIDEGAVLGSLYWGLPVDANGVCTPVQRVEVAVGGRTILSGSRERTMRLDAVLENRSQPVAIVDIDGERYEVEEGDTFATTLRAIAVDQDALVVSHSDKWCPVRAVGVVEDPNDGSIIAMASYPSFDPGAFVDGLTQAQWESLGTINAFTNFAIQGQYAPASTFKVVSYVLALEEGIYPLDRPINDRTLGDESPAPDPATDEAVTDEVAVGEEETTTTTNRPAAVGRRTCAVDLGYGSLQLHGEPAVPIQ